LFLNLILDTFTLKEKYSGKTIEWSYEELIWPADRTKFINPKCSNGDCQTINDLCGVFQVFYFKNKKIILLGLFKTSQLD